MTVITIYDSNHDFSDKGLHSVAKSAVCYRWFG